MDQLERLKLLVQQACEQYAKARTPQETADSYSHCQRVLGAFNLLLSESTPVPSYGGLCFGDIEKVIAILKGAKRD